MLVLGASLFAAQEGSEVRVIYGAVYQGAGRHLVPWKRTFKLAKYLATQEL